MNTSATGGYLAEYNNPIRRNSIENAIHEMIVGLTDFDNTLVRPAYQENPLAEPPPDVNWCAFHATDSNATNYSFVHHVSDGDGEDVVTDWINKEIRLYFYGNLSNEYAGMVRRGLMVEQNRYNLRKAGVAIRKVNNAIQVPELVNDKWIYRTDLVIDVTFEAVGNYAILNLLQSGGTVYSDNFRDGKQLTTEYDTDNYIPE